MLEQDRNIAEAKACGSVALIALRACLFLIVAFTVAGCRSAGDVAVSSDLLEAAVARHGASEARSRSRLDRLATSDPLAFLSACLEHYDSKVRDYRCRFVKRERLGGVLGQEQEMAVLFRESPFSVDVRWLRNADRANRVNYVAGRWATRGKQLAHIEPRGLLRLLVPYGIRRDIHAPDVRAAARRTIDQFGFRNTLDLIVRYAQSASADPEYDLRHVGIEVFDGRACHVFERRLPYDPSNGLFPDRRLRFYVDREWLVPLACYSYADDDGAVLLGSYISRAIEFNVGLTDADFAARRYANRADSAGTQ